MNITTVEIRLEKEKGIPSSWWWELENEDMKTRLKKFDKLGFHLPFKDINIISDNPRIRDSSRNIINSCILEAGKQGADYVVFHHRSISQIHRDHGFAELKTGIEEIANQFDGILGNANLTFCIENADSIRSLLVLEDLVREIDHPNVKMLLDTGHAYTRIRTNVMSNILRYMDSTFFMSKVKNHMPYESYGTLNKFIEQNADILYSLHLHDNNGKDDHLRLGIGNVDFSFVSHLSSIGFTGPLILESRMRSYREIDEARKYLDGFAAS